MTAPTDPAPRPFTAQPSRTELLQAVLVAALCSLLFLGEAVSPARAVVPFAPERYEPLAGEARAAGRVGSAELERGNVTMGDKYNQSLAWDRILQERLRRGELPLWNRELGGGAPFVPQMAQVYQPWNLLLLLGIPSAGMYGPWFFLHQVLFGVFAWHFLRRLGLRQPAALFGCVLAVLCLWTQARVHHNVIVSAALPLFPLLGLIGASCAEGRASAARIGGIALCIGITWSGGFAPVSLQCCYLAAAFALWRVVAERRPRALLTIGAGVLLGALLALAQMVPTLLAAMRSARPDFTGEELAAFGLSLHHLKTLVWPDLLHWPAQIEHAPSWRALEALPLAAARTFNWPETACALGLVGAIAMPVAVATRATASVFFAISAVLAFGLSTAKSPFLELTAVLPGARAGDLRRFLFAFSMAALVLAAIGVERVASSPRARLVAALAALCAALLSAIGLLAPLRLDDAAFVRHWAERLLPRAAGSGITLDSLSAMLAARPDDVAQNRAHELLTFGRTATVALIAALALWRLRAGRLVVVLAALTALELAQAGRGTIVPVERERVTTPPATLAPALEATRQAQAAGTPRPRFGRLLAPGSGPEITLLPPNLAAYHGLEDVFAYSPLPAAAAESLLAALEPGTPIAIGGAGTRGFYRAESLAAPVVDLLGVEFVLAERHALPADGRWRDVSPPGAPEHVRLWQRTEPWPRATFVDRSGVEPDPIEAARRVVAQSAAELRTRVLLSDPQAPAADGDGVVAALVAVVEHGDERVVVDVTCAEPGYLRLADPYDPGWTASVDGVGTPVFEADHRFRAVHLPAGSHRVVFEFRALQVLAPPIVSLLALIAAAGLLLSGARRRR